MTSRTASPAFDLPSDVLAKWQPIVDTMAELVQVPAGLIMRLTGSEIEVFVSSRTRGNPYRVGDKEHFFDSGLYCETVVSTNGRLLVPNALADPDWEDNPDVELDMISYLGFPILHADGRPFGTICVLDSKANSYSATYERLLIQFKDVIESHLALLEMTDRLDQQNGRLTRYLDEIKTLRGIIPSSTSPRDGTTPTAPSTVSVSCMPTPGRRIAMAPRPSDSAATSVAT